ncbi:MAG TPA: hypothetical protein VL860_04430 [Planctomycetota bacterium]|nr:hypothetical protein [Planctomycetota bacterium]
MIQPKVAYRWGQSLGYAAQTSALVLVPGAGLVQQDSYEAPRAGKLIQCRLREGHAYVARVPAKVLPNSMVLVRLTQPVHLQGHACDYAYIRNQDLRS